MTLAVGAMIAGRYRIERAIGEGGMGAVYEATNLKLDKRVAIKVLSDSAAPELAERFQREAIAASRVRHPGIVVIHDADTDEGLPWIAMELLEGESLRARMSRERVPPEEALDRVAEVLDALAAVHDAGIVHRDLKPDNIFLERLPGGHERVKILDFGIAKVAIDQLGRATGTHAAMGTPHYLAPEQATSAKAAGPPADVYGVAVVLYELLSGALPYEADSFGELVRLMFTEGPRSIATLAPEVPAPIAALIDRCLRTDPSARPRDARALLDALREARAAATASTASPIQKTVQLSAQDLEVAIRSAPDGGGAVTERKQERPERGREGPWTSPPTEVLTDPIISEPVQPTRPAAASRRPTFDYAVPAVVGLVGAIAVGAWLLVTLSRDDEPPPRRAEETEVVEPAETEEPAADPFRAPPDVAAPPPSAARTASGLASRVLRAGTGTVHPGPTDRVTVHYTGWRAEDGSMFDSSLQRGQPATFPLDRVIRGWTEGVQLMVVGEKRRLWIPARLAYEGHPNGPQGMLVFDVELLDIL